MICSHRFHVHAVALALLVLGLASAAPADSQLRYRRDLSRLDVRLDGVLVVPLDAAVFAETRDGFPDVRILDDRGAEVPFAIDRGVHRRVTMSQEPVAIQVDDLRVIEGEALEIVATLNDDALAPDGATVHTPLVDFERRVRVYGSHDGDDWTLLADEIRIYDYSRFLDLRRVDIPFQSRGFRRFKFVVEREIDEQRSPIHELSRSRIDGGRERWEEVESILRRPFRIDRIALWRNIERTTEAQPVTSRSHLNVARIEIDRGAKQTRIDVDTGRLPLTRLIVRTPSRNFHRFARVLAPAGNGNSASWVEIGQGWISKFQLEDFRQEQLELNVPERRADRLRIVVDDSDNPPLDVTSIEGDAAEIHLEFVGERNRSYRLIYGSEELDAPRYDAESVLAAFGPDRRRETVALGTPRAEPTLIASPRSPDRFDSARLIPLAFVLMTLVLAWAIIQAVRWADKLPMDDFEG